MPELYAITDRLIEQEYDNTDMYDVVFRYLTVTRRYEAVSVAELFEHLRKNDVLQDDDTLDTVYMDILGWTEIIGKDAEERQRPGILVYIAEEDAFSFAATSKSELAASIPKKRTLKALGSTAAEKALVKLQNEAETPSVEIASETTLIPTPSDPELLEIITSLSRETGSVDQRFVKQYFTDQYPDDPTLAERIQTAIDALCEKGLIDKSARVNNHRFLAIATEGARRANSNAMAGNLIEKQKNVPEINSVYAYAILQAVAVNTTHWQQRVSIREIWNSLHLGAELTPEAEQSIKTQIRLLARKKVLVSGQMKQASGSSIMSKARSHKVFKVGFASQEMKEFAKSAKNSDELHELLGTLDS